MSFVLMDMYRSVVHPHEKLKSAAFLNPHQYLGILRLFLTFKCCSLSRINEKMISAISYTCVRKFNYFNQSSGQNFLNLLPADK